MNSNVSHIARASLPSSDTRLTSLTWRDYLLLALAGALCVMQVVHPFMSDHEVYVRGGKVLLDGGHLYKDFIDVKPPLIYELFAVWMAMFGSSAPAMRMLDVCLQLIVVVVLFRTLLSRTGSRVVAHGATLAFGAYTASLWMPVLLHPETLSFLPIVLLIWIGSKSKTSTRDALVLGTLGGILFMLKYPLFLPVIPVVWMYARRSGRTGKMLMLSFAAFTGVAITVFAFVWYDGMIPAMQQVAAFISGYNSSNASLVAALTSGLDNVADFIANDTSLLLTTCALVALVMGMLRRGKHDLLFSTAVTVLVGLVLSIILERKFNHAHMPRLIPPMAILVGYGVPVIWRACARAWSNRTLTKATLVAIAFVTLLMSPLPRIFRTTNTFAKVAVGGKTWREATGTKHDGLVDLVAMDRAIAVTRTEKPQSMVVLGLGGTLMYSYFPGVQSSKFADSHFFTSSYAPPSWNTEALLEARDADIIVLQNDDVHPRLTGFSSSSREVLLKRTEWVELFKLRRLLHDDGKWSVWAK